VRLDHHAEEWGKCHAATPRSRWECRGASSLPHRGGVHRTIGSMVMQSSSPEQQRLSSARISAIARLVTGIRGADGARGAVGERECAINGPGAPPRWFACRPPWDVMLIAATTSWLTS
jgi:hypothetical protein